MSEAVLIESAGKRERAKAANRQTILEAARRVFAEMGYDAATVRDIIRRTDLASGTFYNYFRSKEEVAEALADDGAARFRPILRELRERASNFEDYLNTSLVAYFEFLVEEQRRDGEGRPAAERRPHMLRSDTPEMQAAFAEARTGLEEAIARGVAPDVDTDYLTSACIGVAQEVGAAMLRRTPHDVEAAARFVSDLILEGIGAGAR